MKKLIFFSCALIVFMASSGAVYGSPITGDYTVLAQQSGQGSQTQAQPMTRSQDWPNVQGSGPPTGP